MNYNTYVSLMPTFFAAVRLTVDLLAKKLAHRIQPSPCD